MKRGKDMLCHRQSCDGDVFWTERHSKSFAQLPIEKRRGLGMSIFSDDLSLILIRMSVDQVSESVSTMLGGKMISGVYGKSFDPSGEEEEDWRLWQYRGHEWTVATDRTIKVSERMPYVISEMLEVQTLRFWYGKGADCYGYAIYDCGKFVEFYHLCPADRRLDGSFEEEEESREDFLEFVDKSDGGLHSFGSLLDKYNREGIERILDQENLRSSIVTRRDRFLDHRLGQLGVYIPDFKEMPIWFEDERASLKESDFCGINDIEDVDLAELYQDGMQPPQLLGS